jgi:hypothetical protein
VENVNFGRRSAVAASTQPARPIIARTIRWLAPIIILAWTALILYLNLAVPSLEEVGRERGLTASSQDAPAMQAITRMGKVEDSVTGGEGFISKFTIFDMPLDAGLAVLVVVFGDAGEGTIIGGINEGRAIKVQFAERDFFVRIITPGEQGDEHGKDDEGDGWFHSG